MFAIGVAAPATGACVGAMPGASALGDPPSGKSIGIVLAAGAGATCVARVDAATTFAAGVAGRFM
jgi:hypothetical protein